MARGWKGVKVVRGEGWGKVERGEGGESGGVGGGWHVGRSPEDWLPPCVGN